MQRRRIVDLSARAALAILAAALLRPSPGVAQSVSLAPSTMPRIGSVSERYQSYNVEMVEVTGGRFWKPYSAEPDPQAQQSAPAAGDAGRGHARRHECGPVPVSAADRPGQRALAQARRRARAGLCPRQRNVGEHDIFFRDRPAACGAAGRLQGRAFARAVEGRRRFRAGGERADRHLLRHRGRNARRRRCLDRGAGSRAGRLHQRRRRPHRRGRVHERAEPRRHGWGAGRLRRRRLRPRLQALPCLCQSDRARHADPRAGLGRRDRRRTGPGGWIEPDDAQPADGVAARRGRCRLLSPLRSALAALRRHGRADHGRRRALGGVAGAPPTRRWPSTASCATRSRPASRCG